MATQTNSRRSAYRKQQSRRIRYIGKPSGVFQDRVVKVGAQRFGVVTVDCAKRRSKWMLCDFFGRVIIEPAVVEHNAGSLRVMTQQVQAAIESEGIIDTIVGVEVTGIYHRPVLAAFRKAGFDAREVHSYTSAHFRKTLHPNEKTDDHDLEAIFQAVCNGFGLTITPPQPIYQALQQYVRFRRTLVKQRAVLQTQIRDKMHRTMPGYADLFEASRLFHNRVAFCVAKAYPSAKQIEHAGAATIAAELQRQKIRFQQPTIDRIISWSRQAADPDACLNECTEIWKGYLKLHAQITEQVMQTERKIAVLLAKTPYILLLSLSGINVISAGELAGEAGPIEHYAGAGSINGRAGLFPSRYQSDEVNRTSGVAWSCNRRLRAACILVAHNLIKCHPYYRGQAALLKQKKVATRDIECRIANRANRMVFQLVGGKQVWRGRGVDRDYILRKLMVYLQGHETELVQIAETLTAASEHLPKSIRSDEAKQLPRPPKRRRSIASLGELLLPLMIRLGVQQSDQVESKKSEA